MDRKNSLLRRRIARVVEAAVLRHQAETGDRLEDVAGALGISTGHLHNIMRAERDAPCPADLVVRIARELGDRSVLEALGMMCGEGPGAASAGDVAGAAVAAGDAGTAVMGMLSEFLRAVADGVVSEDELAGLEVAAPEVVEALAGLVKRARGMRRGGGVARAGSLAEAEGRVHHGGTESTEKAGRGRI